MSKRIESANIRIFLVRHGETEWNRIRRFQGRSDLPLNQTGNDQARALALALKDKSFTAIYSSPLIRAMETARHIRAFHPLTPMFEEEGLIEMDLGDFEGIDARRWIKEYPDFRKSWEKDPSALKMPGGEGLQEVQARAMDALQHIVGIYPTDSTLLICSHNFVILTILCHVLEIPLDRFRELRQETAAFNVLCQQGNRFYAEVENERSHLQQFKENVNS